MNPWTRAERWYARTYVCPQWGHKPYGEYGWDEDTEGKFDKQAALKGVCENCGGVIPDDAT